jgi:hypothetical protein
VLGAASPAISKRASASSSPSRHSFRRDPNVDGPSANSLVVLEPTGEYRGVASSAPLIQLEFRSNPRGSEPHSLPLMAERESSRSKLKPLQHRGFYVARALFQHMILHMCLRSQAPGYETELTRCLRRNSATHVARALTQRLPKVRQVLTGADSRLRLAPYCRP